MQNLRIKTRDEKYIPQYQTKGSAGMDLVSAEDLIIQPGEREKISTGICIQLEQGYEAQIRPRSGLALKYGVTVLNAPSTIDSDYRGEISVILINHGKEPFHIWEGDRIAQMVVAKVEVVQSISVVEELDETERGTGAFGSTGTS